MRVRGSLASVSVVSFALLSGGCGIVTIEKASAKNPASTGPETSAPADAKPAGKPSVADLEKKLGAILAEPDAAAALDKLGALRLELLERRRSAIAAIPVGKRRQTSPEERTRVLGVEGRALLRRLHHERARLYLGQNRPAQALAEVGVLGGFDLGPVLLECGADEAVCKTVREAIDKRYPGLCSAAGCSATSDYLWNQATFALLTVSVHSVKKAPAGWLVTGAEFGPDTYRRCVDSFQTDKILGIKGDRVQIERTTWCKKMETQYRPGYRFTYLIADAPFAPMAGGQMVLLGDPNKLRTGQQGATGTTQIDKPTLIELRVGKDDTGVSTSPSGDDAQVFRHNQVVPPELIDSDLYWKPTGIGSDR